MDPRGFNIVTRPMWGAKPCNGYESPHWPIQNVVVYLDTESPPCIDRVQCFQVLRRTQEFHQKRGLADLHYNFMIGSDGNVYEGRGWFRQPSKCVRNHEYDEKNYAIAYIGNWTKDQPVPDTIKLAFYRLVNYGIEQGWIAPNYNVIEDKELLPVFTRRKPKDRSFRMTFTKKTNDFKVKKPKHAPRKSVRDKLKLI